MILPTLYKTSKTGTIQVCNISHLNDTFTVEWGQLGGVMQSKITACYATNAGKSNERSPTEQATFEAKAKWNKKIKSGYSTNSSAPTTVQLPMKVKDYQSNTKNVKFPCISTPKLNGVNGTYKLENNTLKLYSRGGDLYPEIPHLVPQILNTMSIIGSTELNGELYTHGEHLQDITSAVKKPKELSKKLEFHVFDIMDSDLPYEERRTQMLSFLPTLKTPNVDIVTGVKCSSFDEIENHYNTCISKNFEGTVIKNLDGYYKHNIRSSDQFKYKKTQDDEFKVINYNLDKNNHPVYHCQAKNPEKSIFKVKRKGTALERSEDAAIAPANIGKWLNVEYEMLSKDGKPLKPVGNHFRACDLRGNPKE